MGEDIQGDQGTPGDPGAQQQGVIRDGMSAAEVETLLTKERDRHDKQRKAEQSKFQDSLEERVQSALAEERERAKKDSADLAMEDKQKAETRAESAEAESARLQLELVRQSYIAEHAADLPAAYRRTVTGTTDEELQASLEAARAEYAADFETRTGRPPDTLGSPGRPAQQPELNRDTNPWLPESRNITEQGRLLRSDPDRARNLMRAAGRPQAEIDKLLGG